MKCFLERGRTKRWRRPWLAVAAGILASFVTVSAFAELPSWLRYIELGSSLEAVFFRMMSVPGGSVAFRRPPGETRPALGELIKAQPGNAELYSLRALEDEQGLDFSSAESDWKSYVSKSTDKIGAEQALADFYHRRLRPQDEIATLSLIANAASLPAEKLTPVTEQRSWKAFERIYGIIQNQALPREISITQYRAWIVRYPEEPSLYARFLSFLVAEHQYAAAAQLIAGYRNRFPADEIFPIKSRAMIEYRQGSVEDGLAVYERSFQPLWDPELVKSYFDLLRETQNLRRFLDQAQTSLNRNPADLSAMARVFYYHQQQGRLEAARQTIDDFRRHKESSKSPWNSDELYVCARLLEDIHAYPEAGRYYFALYGNKGSGDTEQRALEGLTDLLLSAPEAPIRFGSGDLSIYRDIATLDQDPGYLNGALSLVLNTTRPASHYFEEELRAIPYFHRSRAAELLSLLDQKFPGSARRSELHFKLLSFYSGVGESDAVIRGGQEFLAVFPNATERTSVALLMADAYARKNQTSEFAIYDSVLRELSAGAQNVPLGARPAGPDFSYSSEPEHPETALESEEQQVYIPRASTAFQISASGARPHPAVRSPEYARVLERYLARLVEMKQIPQALEVLRREIDRNPDDPGLYERLAVFLDQNRLGTEQEEVYRRAIAHFADPSWYDRLARFYLRYRRQAEFEELSREAIKSFNGTDLERYFHNVVGSPALYLRLNQYANRRFPHDPVFVRNLLNAYRTPATYDEAAWEALIRQHWFEESDLRNHFFEFLTSSGRLESELRTFGESAPDEESWQKNPAAADFLANANLWRSHFEESAAPLQSLTAQYPGDREMARNASSVYRSLAYFDPSATATAVKIEDNLLKANPGDRATLARIGDIYADRERFAEARPYWERIAEIAPAEAGGYLEAATIYWDYYRFDDALRLINQGRLNLASPCLYCYEAGAIYENKRDYPHAIDEYVKGALENSGSSAEYRLLALARRPSFRDLVDQKTSTAASLGGASMPAIYLRVKVLEAENRKPEMESFLDRLARNAGSIEQAESVENLAQQKSLEIVRQHALERRIALTTDPITRLGLRYSLIRLYEDRKDFSAAEKNIEVLYHENPKSLGVVRSTVDFFWRTENYPRAISVLLEAAKDAYPDLSKQFTYEAARKASDAKLYQQARDLLTRLLANDPYDSEYLAAMADAFARAGDDRGLERFYREEIASFSNSALPAESRRSQISSLRRGLIPALTRLRDYQGAIDQYIELINSFPEDEALARESAFYAERYQHQQQLVGFYQRTVAQSPRDYRWALVLARVDTNLEDYPAAIDAYGKAIAVRPDRSDLFIARAELEERLMHFEDAISDYQRIYQLTYKDPQWMEKVAEDRARQGKVNETVVALKTALIEGRPQNAGSYFAAASRLETWGMLPEARSLGEQGVKLAGSELLSDPELLDGVKTYARTMTRLRNYQQAYSTLGGALADASSNLKMLAEDIAKQGMGSLGSESVAARIRQLRIEKARNAAAAALEEMGHTANAYFTPEERLAFAAFVESKRNGMDLGDVEEFAVPLAKSAALADEEARWRFEVLTGRAPGATSYGQLQALIELERQRGRFAELGRELEQFAAILPAAPPGRRDQPLLAAADAYGSAGKRPDELRILTAISGDTGNLDSLHQRRLFELLLAYKPEKLVRITANWTAAGEQAAAYVLAHGTPALSRAVVEARGAAQPAVWRKSYDSLVGLYFSDTTPEVNSAFLAALGDLTIAERLSKPVDRAQQLAGNTWFYYGSRYGEYLTLSKRANPEDYLAAELEESPATVRNYVNLADYYAGAGDLARAIENYRHALELSPNRPDVYNKQAIAYYRQGEQATALASWKQALTELGKELNGAHVPESFWADSGSVCDELRRRRLFPNFKADIEANVRTYLRSSGSWRSNAVLKPAFLAAGDPELATDWLLELSSSAPDPVQVLSDLVDVSWIPPAPRVRIYQRILKLKQDRLAGLSGLERDTARQDLAHWQVRWISYLVATKKYAEAEDAISNLSSDERQLEAAALVPLELEAAARVGTLEEKIAAYRKEPQDGPPANLLRAAARELVKAGDREAARKILEFAFAREINEHQLEAANFLGLAEIRLASGDMPGTLELLRRLTVVVGRPFQNLDPAAALLERTGHSAEAIEFLDQLVKSAPWDSSYRLRQARARLAAGQDPAAAGRDLASIASASDNPYELRSQAAVALAGYPHGALGSGELDILAENPREVTPTAADRFYFYAARIRAAELASDPEIRVQLLSHCVIDFPRRDQARFPLFASAVSAGSREFALAVVEPLLKAPLGRSRVYAEQAVISRAEDGEEEEGEISTPSARVRANLSPAERVQVAQMIGETLVDLGRLDDSLPYFALARRSQESATARKMLDKRISEVKAVLHVDDENTARQPVLHAALEQDRIVRPKLTAHAVRPVSATAGPKGVSKR